MRVLVFIDDTLAPSARDVVARRWSELVPVLNAQDVEVSLVTLRDRQDLHDRLEQAGYETYALDVRTGRALAWGAARLGRIVRRGRFDLIHSHEVIPASIAGVVTRTRAMTRVFFRDHTSGSRRLVYASRVAASLNHFTMGPSEAVAHFARVDDRTNPARIKVAPNGVVAPRAVDPQETLRLRRRLSIPDQSGIVVTVARLRPEKGIRILLEAVALLANKRDAECVLVVVGDGPERERLMTVAAGIGGLRAHFVGHQDDVDVWLALADIVAVPSLREAFGLSAVEALAAGCPVVASRVGGLRETVEPGRTGTLVEPGDAGALAQAIADLLVEPAKREKMGATARQTYQARFTLAAQADRWRRCWAEMTKGRR